MLFVSLESNFLISLYKLDISLLSDVGLVKIFSQSVVFHFVLLTLSFALQKLCSFVRSHLLIFDLGHSDWCEVESQGCFDLHFPDD